MVFNGSEKIDNNAGDYIVLTDYGMEGISVSFQTDNPQDAINWITGHNYGSPMTLVKLVRLETREI